MRGEAGVESVVGQGSLFWFTAVFGRQPSLRRTLLQPAALAGKRVLVVDGNATNREVLLDQLAAWGLAGTAAESSARALALLAAVRAGGQPFDLAILDQQLAGMDGLQLAAQVRADPAHATLPLVLLTSLARRGDAGQVAERGFSAFLSKPVRQAEMLRCLSAVLTGEAGDRPALVTRHSPVGLRRTVRRVLVAEDNAVNQKVATGLLKRLGLRADAVADGAEAVKAVETIPYDLVLMDMQMPEVDGLAATRRIRASSRAAIARVPIVAMTANAMAEDERSCREAGMDDFLAKPVTPKQLFDVLDRWLPKDPGEPQPGA
jgi:CheY-like chemotaxis protein